MSNTFATQFFRKHIRHPRLYSYARRAMLGWQLLTRQPDDGDFAAFQHMKLPRDGVIIDIGANGGQAAVAFSFLLPKMKIMSFEPNPAVWRDLDFVSKILGHRFSYQKIGLGPKSDTMKLYVPCAQGLPITTRGSIDKSAATQHCQTLAQQLDLDVHVEETTVDIRTLDSLALRPDAIKIDVEGFESEVLKGMTQTLEQARPVLMLESNANDLSCQQFLKPLNYEFAYFDADKGQLLPVKNNNIRNWFAIPAERAGDIINA